MVTKLGGQAMRITKQNLLPFITAQILLATIAISILASSVIVILHLAS
jgi:hypothetical protein